MKKRYAVIDNLYLVSKDNKGIFKHLFRPLAKYGKNSANEVKNCTNNIKAPKKAWEFKDNTKNEIHDKKETI